MPWINGVGLFHTCAWHVLVWCGSIALDVPRNHQVVQQMPSMPCPRIKSLQVLNSFNLGTVNLNNSDDTESLIASSFDKNLMDVKCGACTGAASAGASAA